MLLLLSSQLALLSPNLCFALFCCDKDDIKGFDALRADAQSEAKKKSDEIAARKAERMKELAAKRKNMLEDLAREEMLTAESFEDELKQVKKETYEAACALSRPPKRARLNGDGDGSGSGDADNNDKGNDDACSVIADGVE